MKKTIASLLLFAAVPLCAQDCAKSADACAAPKKSLSPFLAASAAEPAAVKTPAKSAPAAAVKPAPVPAAKTAEAAAVPTAPAAPAAAAGRAASSPAWLLFVAALLVGLYFYLNGGKKGKRK